MFLMIYFFECYMIILITYQNKFIELYILELNNLYLYPYFSWIKGSMKL